jgi:2-keto-4-pentenoate hydratase
MSGEAGVDASCVAEAARLLVEARRTGKPLRELPVASRPLTAADANAIIDAVTTQLEEETIAGWKIGFLFAPRQPPFICPLFASRVFTSPARVPVALTPLRRIEPEISFRLTRDLPRREQKYSVEEVAAAVVACPSLEIVDTRFDTTHRSLRQMIDDRATKIEAFADHITTGAYVVGDGRADWDKFDFATMPVKMRTPERVLVESVGGHAFVDPFLPGVVLVNALRRRADLRAGQVLVTGSFTGFYEAEADQPVTVEFDGFGSAQATFVSGV